MSTYEANIDDVRMISRSPDFHDIMFDLGVFSLVLGATVLMLIAFAHQSVRRLRASRIATTSEEEVA